MPVLNRHFLFNMNLAIDIGNSFTHFAVYNGSKIIYSSKCVSKSKISLKAHLSIIKKVFSLTNIGIASVNNKTEKYISGLCKINFTISPLIVNNASKLPIRIKIKSPGTLGADRICNAVFGYVYFKMKANVLIADFGTANTYDVITHKGEFIGGIIAPGIMTSSAALNINTSKLPLLEYSKLSKKAPLVGKNTNEAIQSGLVNYMKYASEGIVQSLKSKFKGKLKVILTGGSSELLLKNVNFDYIYIENTVLDGINIILNYQTGI